MFGFGGMGFDDQKRLAQTILENGRDFAIFFGAIGLYLDEEIEKANAGVGDGTSGLIRRGRVKKPLPARAWTGKTSLELKLGSVRTCTLSLSGLYDAKLKPGPSRIEAELETNQSDEENIGREQICFLLESRLSGTKAYQLGADGRPRPEKEFGAPEIAKTIVKGMVRGHFDSSR